MQCTFLERVDTDDAWMMMMMSPFQSTNLDGRHRRHVKRRYGDGPDVWNGASTDITSEGLQTVGVQLTVQS